MVIQKLDPSASLSNLLFDSTPIWIQIHNLPIDWRMNAIVRRIVRFVGAVLVVDRISLTGDSLG